MPVYRAVAPLHCMAPLTTLLHFLPQLGCALQWLSKFDSDLSLSTKAIAACSILERGRQAACQYYSSRQINKLYTFVALQ
jgi:hypothetical protein